MAAVHRNEAEFKAEIRKKQVWHLCAYLLASCVAVVLFVLFTGIGRRPLLTAVGLERWLYGSRSSINCSLPENRDDPFCTPRDSLKDEQQWRDLRNSGGKMIPFNLNGR